MSSKRKKSKPKQSKLESDLDRLANEGMREVNEMLENLASTPLELPEPENIDELLRGLPLGDETLRELAGEEKADPIEWLEDIICQVDRWRKRHGATVDPDGMMKDTFEELMEFRARLIAARGGGG